MRISFLKVSNSDTKFSLNLDGIDFFGLFKRDRDKVKIDGTIKGAIDLNCNRCGVEFSYDIDEDLLLWVNDGYYKGDEIDIIETHDGFVDLKKILISEIESIKSDYHYCGSCIKI